MADDTSPRSARLDSWKEIASYLGRDVRTVQRWERRDGLPIHRLQHTKLGSVFAYPEELDSWRRERDVSQALRPNKPASAFSPKRLAWIAAGMSAAVLAAASWVLPVSRSDRLGERGPQRTARPVAPRAYESYLTGLWRLKGDARNPQESVRDFAAAATADPSFAPAYVGLAAAYNRLGSTGTGVLPVAETHPRTLAAAKRAVELDPQFAEAHTTLAHAYQNAWQWTEAQAEYRRALDLDPNLAETHARYSAFLTWRGETHEAAAHARLARGLDPLSRGRTVDLAWVLYQARRYEEAIRELQAVLATDARNRGALWFLGFVLIDSSRLDEAISTLERLVELRDRHPSALGLLARAYGRAGRRAAALEMVDELKRRERDGYVPPAPFVHAYIGLGDYDNAFVWLERSYRERSHIMQMLRTHPLYDPIRGDRRFTSLLERVGLG